MMESERAYSRIVYDRLADHYDRAMQPLERWFLARMRAKVFHVLPENSRILEIGAGTGANFSFYPHGARVVASEISCRMIEKAQQKTRPVGVELVCNGAEALPFAGASFDAAAATLVFCSVKSPAQAFSELRRVVRPGGCIALLEHVRPDGALGFLFDALNLITVPFFDDHFNRRTAYEARRAGLTIERVERRICGIVQLIVCRV